jgi:uncharacterized protein YbjT (DUF2867 family)
MSPPVPAAAAPLAGPVLVTGATGFVGRHLLPALEAAGLDVRCASRDPNSARSRFPHRQWVEADLHRPHTLAPALMGCSAAYYLVHSVGSSHDYAAREREAALDFRAAAAAAGVERIVYLGGVAPPGPPSRHLASRLETGAILRQGTVPCVELRAAMVVGAGGESWAIVEQLAGRLPAMVLPRWLRNRSCPVAIEDVVVALLAGLDLPPGWSGALDVPGPEIVSHRDLLRLVARRLGHRPPMLDVPVLSPHLSAYWIGLVTTANLALARELVEGLRTDLLPADQGIWQLLADHERLTVERAVEEALADRNAAPSPGPAALARLRGLGARWVGERRPLVPR